jgi:hypothetical protein
MAFEAIAITTRPLRNSEKNDTNNLGGRIPAYLEIECFAAIPAALNCMARQHSIAIG